MPEATYKVIADVIVSPTDTIVLGYTNETVYLGSETAAQELTRLSFGTDRLPSTVRLHQSVTTTSLSLVCRSTPCRAQQQLHFQAPILSACS
jgi:hypothetical protein